MSCDVCGDTGITQKGALESFCACLFGKKAARQADLSRARAEREEVYRLQIHDSFLAQDRIRRQVHTELRLAFRARMFKELTQPGKLAQLSEAERNGISSLQKKLMPLGFSDVKHFQAFMADCINAARTYPSINYLVLIGSSTTYFSINPSKPPEHHFDAKAGARSDLDISVLGERVPGEMEKHSYDWKTNELGTRKEVDQSFGTHQTRTGGNIEFKLNIAPHKFETPRRRGAEYIPSLESVAYEMIYGRRRTHLVYPKLNSVSDDWSKTLGREVNFNALVWNDKTASIVKDPGYFVLYESEMN